MALLDPAVLKGLRGDVGDETVAKLIDLFLEDSPGLLGELQEAVAARDLARMKRPAHTLKSTSRTLGAVALADLCRELEVLCEERDAHKTLQKKVAAAAKRYETTKKALQRERTKLDHAG